MKKRSIFILLLVVMIGLFIPKDISAETYDGEYSIEYLLKNYSVVTMGQKDLANGIGGVSHASMNKGDFYCGGYSETIEGAALVSGNVDASRDNSFTFGTDSGDIKSFVGGNIGSEVTPPSQLVTDSGYVDFNKMYTKVLLQSQMLAENSEYHINSAKLEVSKPGVYLVHNSANLRIDNGNINNNSLLIKNYDKNSIYVFNYYNEYVAFNTLPAIMIMESNSSNAVSLEEYINSGDYTGNIIFNFPNAKQIDITYIYQSLGFYFNDSNLLKFNANIIAPNAKVYILYKSDTYYHYGTIIANSLITYNGIKKANYKLDKKIVEDNSKSYIENIKDYSDDYYSRNYSISDLLQNYSLVTLGHKEIDSKAKLAGKPNGSARMFHITGQALINGNMVFDIPGFNTAFDLESNKVTESYINGSNGDVRYYYGYTVIQPWDNMNNDNINYQYQKNSLLVKGTYYAFNNMVGLFTDYLDNYVNFDRLYNNVVSEQKEIGEGQKAKVGEDKVVHINVGGSYVIDDINNVDEIVFDKFSENKDKITIITIKNEGDINFPLISRDGGGYKGIVTNDYFGKEEATHLYEQDTFVQDSYYGNIIFNVPNATYIKLKENAPFAGHLIAPNADVETPELHFAGCFIVNSIYGEGNTEAHFYPLTATATYDVPEYGDLSSSEKRKLDSMRLNRLLGGKGSQIERVIIGDEAQFREEENNFNNILDKEEKTSQGSNNSIVNILTNPKTLNNLIIIVSILVVGGLSSFVIVKKRKKLGL